MYIITMRVKFSRLSMYLSINNSNLIWTYNGSQASTFTRSEVQYILDILEENGETVEVDYAF